MIHIKKYLTLIIALNLALQNFSLAQDVDSLEGIEEGTLAEKWDNSFESFEDQSDKVYEYIHSGSFLAVFSATLFSRYYSKGSHLEIYTSKIENLFKKVSPQYLNLYNRVKLEAHNLELALRNGEALNNPEYHQKRIQHLDGLVKNKEKLQKIFLESFEKSITPNGKPLPTNLIAEWNKIQKFENFYKLGHKFIVVSSSIFILNALVGLAVNTFEDKDPGKFPLLESSAVLGSYGMNLFKSKVQGLHEITVEDLEFSLDKIHGFK